MHYTSKKLDEQRAENKRLQVDNEDLQREFQREREGHLGTIRELQKQLLLYQTMAEKMSRIIPRNCNYSNLDRIREQARYDEQKDSFNLPEPTREDVQLPHMGSLPSNMNNGRLIQQEYVTPSRGSPMANNEEYENDFIESDEYANTSYEEVSRRHTRNTEVPPATDKSRNKRQEQLLTENLVLQRAKRPLQINDNDYMNRRLNPYDAPARLSRKYNLSSDKQ